MILQNVLVYPMSGLGPGGPHLSPRTLGGGDQKRGSVTVLSPCFATDPHPVETSATGSTGLHEHVGFFTSVFLNFVFTALKRGDMSVQVVNHLHVLTLYPPATLRCRRSSVGISTVGIPYGSEVARADNDYSLEHTRLVQLLRSTLIRRCHGIVDSR